MHVVTFRFQSFDSLLIRLIQFSFRLIRLIRLVYLIGSFMPKTRTLPDG